VAGFSRTNEPLHQLKRCLKRSNGLRDLEVCIGLLEAVGAEHLNSAVTTWMDAQLQRKQLLREELLEHVMATKVSTALRRMETRMPDALANLSGATLRRAVKTHYTALCISIDRRLCLGAALFEIEAEWHALRLDCKRLRYMGEAHGDLLDTGRERQTNAARRAQDGLGDLRDMNLLIADLGKLDGVDASLIDRLASMRTERLAVASATVAKLTNVFQAPTAKA
jgi:CHAD domain-containing protein